MNKLFVLTLTSFFSIPLFNSQNLQFKEAVFYDCGSGERDGNSNTPMFTSELKVETGQVLKITFMSCSCVNGKQFGVVSYIREGLIAINENIIKPETLNELWLPAGVYQISGYEPDEIRMSGTFKGVLSGLLYEVVK